MKGRSVTTKTTMDTKITNNYWCSFSLAFVFFVTFVVFVVPVAVAQDTEDFQVPPIECWTRTSAGAIRVGEPFTLVLTCAVLETTSTIVVADESTLDPAALQLPPFDVVGGARPDDVRTSSRRFFQYEYTMRFIGETFGQDVTLPGPIVSYRVQSRADQGAALEGRQREYYLPARQMRVVSLVPAGSAELRDPQAPTLAEIQQRRLRGNALRIGSLTAFVMTGAVVVWALAGLLRKPAEQRSTAPPAPPDRAVLRTVRRELDAVRRDRLASGWTPDLSAQALRALRTAGALAASGTLAHVPAARAAQSDGQLRVTSGWPRRRVTLVSGAVSAATLPDSPQFEDLRAALDQFTAATYGRDPNTDALDETLGRAERAIDQLARERRWQRLTKLWVR